MGHRRIGGRISQQTIAGAQLLRVDVPAREGDGFVASQFYGGSAIYCLTPCGEQEARAVAYRNQPAPVSRWELPPAPKKEPEIEDAHLGEGEPPQRDEH